MIKRSIKKIVLALVTMSLCPLAFAGGGDIPTGAFDVFITVASNSPTQVNIYGMTDSLVNDGAYGGMDTATGGDDGCIGGNPGAGVGKVNNFGVAGGSWSETVHACTASSLASYGSGSFTLWGLGGGILYIAIGNDQIFGNSSIYAMPAVHANGNYATIFMSAPPTNTGAVYPPCPPPPSQYGPYTQVGPMCLAYSSALSNNRMGYDAQSQFYLLVVGNGITAYRNTP